ncbi:MAG: hypothetical protein ABJD97_03815 [Betaproteobacteria bacterium]
MTDDLRTRLQAARVAAADRFAGLLLQHDADQAQVDAAQHELAQLDAALAALPAAPVRRWRAEVGAALAAAIVLSLAATLDMPSAAFTLELEADSATFDLPDAGRLEPQVAVGGVRVGGFDTFDAASPALASLRAANPGGTLDLRAPAIQVSRIAWPAASRLGIDATAAKARITVESGRAAANLRLEAAGAASVALGAAHPAAIDLGAGEWIELGSAGDKPRPLTIALAVAPDKPWRWADLRPADIRFMELQPSHQGGSEPASSLRGATVRLPATDAVVQLRKGDGLELDGLRVERSELTVADTVRLTLVGTARAIRRSSGGVQQSLKPTWLEFLARNHGVATLWAGAVFLWGGRAWLAKLFERH